MSVHTKDPLALKSIISEFFRDVDFSVVKENNQLKQMQANCVEQTNPFACYFTLVLGHEPKITWRHNTGGHFGIVDLQYEDIFRLVHPAWLFTYVSFAKAIYEVAYAYPELIMTKGASAGSLVPLRHRSGKYYWYHQISVRAANVEDKLAAHLNYYHRSTVYAGQLPTMPVLTTFGEENPILTKSLNRLSLEFLPDFLADFLQEAQVKFILQYREIIASRAGKKIIQRELLKQLDGVDTIDNLNKIKQRIKKNLIAYFQHPSLNSAHNLAIWLNRYFPLLDESKSPPP